MTKDNNTIYVLDNLRGCMDTITGIPEKTAQDINLIKKLLHNMGYRAGSYTYTIKRRKGKMYRCTKNGMTAIPTKTYA